MTAPRLDPILEGESAPVPSDGEAMVARHDEVGPLTLRGWRLRACVTEEEVQTIHEPMTAGEAHAARQAGGCYPPARYDRKGRAIPEGHLARDLVVRVARFVLVRDASSALSFAQAEVARLRDAVAQSLRDSGKQAEELAEATKQRETALAGEKDALGRASRWAQKHGELEEQCRRLEAALGDARRDLAAVRRHWGEKAVEDVLGGEKRS